MASPDYSARCGTPETPADQDRLAFEGQRTFRIRSFGSDGDLSAIAIRPRLEVNTADALIEAAGAGRGVASMTSYQVAEALRAGTLVRLLRAYDVRKALAILPT